jgi:phospholipid/cholesterol/gamma-HCH transport system permease protein
MIAPWSDARANDLGDASPASLSDEVVIEVPEPLASETAPRVLRALGSLERTGGPVRIDMRSVRRVDTFGLAALASGIRAIRDGGRPVRVVAIDPAVRRRAALLRIHDVLESPPASARPRPRAIDRLVDGLGRFTDAIVVILALFAEGVRYAIPDGLFSALGREHFARQLDQIGLSGIPIVVGVNFLVGAIMAYQTAYVLEFYGATLFVARGVGISMTRELGPLMAAVLLAGRSGSAIAAELGAMVVNEETDALEMMALEPRRFLFSPRFTALIIAVPALSIVASVAGILGGATVMVTSYHFTWGMYLNESITTILIADVESGLLKSVFFGAIIAAVSCQRGLALRGGPEAVGLAATSAVVQSIVGVVIFDAVFTALTRGVL